MKANVIVTLNPEFSKSPIALELDYDSLGRLVYTYSKFN